MGLIYSQSYHARTRLPPAIITKRPLPDVRKGHFFMVHPEYKSIVIRTQLRSFAVNQSTPLAGLKIQLQNVAGSGFCR